MHVAHIDVNIRTSIVYLNSRSFFGLMKFFLYTIKIRYIDKDRVSKISTIKI